MKKFLLFILICYSVSGQAQCVVPTSATISNTSSSSVYLTWTEVGAATQWDIIALPAGTAFPATEDTPSATAVSNTSFFFTGLTPLTCYDFYLRSSCGVLVSQWILAGSACTTNYFGCGGYYVDNGGITGNYLPDTDEIITICPNNPGDLVTVTFTSFNTEANFDGLYIYSGSSTNGSPVLSGNGSGSTGDLSDPGAFWGNVLPAPITSSSPDGCLTFHFISDNLTNLSGYIANVTCGPPANAVALTAFFDANGNGTKEESEQTFQNGSFTISTTGGNVVYPYYSSNGYLVAVLDPAETYTASFIVDSEYASFFAADPATIPNISGAGYTTLNYPVVSSNPFSNIQVSIYGGGNPVAGTNHGATIHYANTGNTLMSGTLNFTADPAMPISATIPATTTTPTGFSFNYSLQPFEQGEIYVTSAIPSIPDVYIGQLVYSSVSVEQPDDILSDNTFSTIHTIVASYDPNDITESRGPQIDIDDFTADDYLYYTIRFQNTGNAPAMNVRLENTLDEQFDTESFRMIASSHNYQVERNNNQLTFHFDNINLPFEDQNEPSSHGYAMYKVKLNPGFAVGDIVPNAAEIYFDTNPAIITETFNTQFVTQLGTGSFDTSKIVMYPNPASREITIRTANNGQTSARIMDVLGKTILERQVGSGMLTIGVSSLSKGVYLVEITSGQSERTTRKLIVE